MSRMWDTPEYWARVEADEMLREMADCDPAALANSFERSAASYDGDPETAAAIIAELRRRAVAGVRFWTGPEAILAAAAGKPADITDDDIPW